MLAQYNTCGQQIIPLFKMADKVKVKSSEDDQKKEVFVPRSANDIQKMKLEKLMSNPDKPVNIPGQKKEWKPSDPKDFVRFVMGSSAGAGSGEFHVYRATRRREYNRQRYIDEKAKEEDANEEYHRKQEENKLKAEEKTSKKRAKRLKKKQKKQASKKKKSENIKHDGGGEINKNGASDDEEHSEDDSEEEKS